MLKRKRKTKSILKITIYIFFSSVLLLLILNIIFPKFSWFKKPIVLNPVIRNSETDQLKIGKLLLGANIRFSLVTLAQDYYDIELRDGGRIYISSKKNFASQISSLTAILKQLTINGKRFNLIDFRFDKPIIVFGK